MKKLGAKTEEKSRALRRKDLRHVLQMEQLEKRELFAVGVGVDFGRQTLLIDGPNGNDHVTLFELIRSQIGLISGNGFS